MAAYLPAIDNYIRQAAPFAQPILQHLRALVHQTCPDVEEKIKWGMPHFDYRGEMMCSMAAFKQHAVFRFWKAALMKDPQLMEAARQETAMGHLGRICTLQDLPANRTLVRWIREAMALNEQGIKLPAKNRGRSTTPPEIPDDVRAALAQNQQAQAQFNRFPPSHQREYLDWITAAKTAATRQRRMATTLEWLVEGKSRNWKYEKR